MLYGNRMNNGIICSPVDMPINFYQAHCSFHYTNHIVNKYLLFGLFVIGEYVISPVSEHDNYRNYDVFWLAKYFWSRI